MLGQSRETRLTKATKMAAVQSYLFGICHLLVGLSRIEMSNLKIDNFQSRYFYIA